MTSAVKTDGHPRSPAPGVPLLTVKQVSEMLQVHPRTVWRMAAAGDIPAPITLSKKIVRWRLSDLQEFLERQR